jgi:hypothetical protein
MEPATGRQATPEAQALAILAKIAGRMDRG